MTTKQWAILIVQSYPYLPQLEVHLEAVAAEGGAPTKAQILAAAQSNPMMREWQHLNKYLESVASKNSGEHTPLFERAVKAGVVSSEPTSGPLANSKHLASNSSSLMGAGHMQRGNASGQVQFNQDTGYGLPGLLDLYGGTSDSTTPAFDAGLNIVQTMSAPVGQAGAPANMLCGSTSVPFRLDPAVAAIPPMPASYQQDPAYMFRNEFMLQQPSVAAGVQQRGAFKQHEAGNAFRSSVPMPFAPDAAGTLPFSLPHMH